MIDLLAPLRLPENSSGAPPRRASFHCPKLSTSTGSLSAAGATPIAAAVPTAMEATTVAKGLRIAP
jgi:hypothetical protein